MKTQDADNRVRPVLVVVLICLLAAIAIPVWIMTRPDVEPAHDTSAAQATAVASTNNTLARRGLSTHRVPVARPAAPQKPALVPPVTTLEDRWGIQVCSMRLSMMNSIVDLRYKVLDPDKAASLANGKTAAYILEPVTGARLVMPTPPKEGAFPPSANKLVAGKTYFSMVSNQRGALKSGDVVSVMIGDSLATNLTIE